MTQVSAAKSDAEISPTTAFEREVASRFGLVPNFFPSAPDAPEIVERLWDFAKSAYLDNPIPSLFKERLFVYLSRFCEARYCILRHCAFLVGYGHSSGDPSARPQSITQAIRLLSAPTPWQRNLDAVFSGLPTGAVGEQWPLPETELEDRCSLLLCSFSWNQRVHTKRGARCAAPLAAGALSI